MAGLVKVFDPATDADLGVLFRTSGFATGGLASDLTSEGLRRLGITRETPDRVDNVWVEKDAFGEPTGRISGAVINYYAYDRFAEKLWRELPFLDLEAVEPGTLRRVPRGSFRWYQEFLASRR